MSLERYMHCIIKYLKFKSTEQVLLNEKSFPPTSKET